MRSSLIIALLMDLLQFLKRLMVSQASMAVCLNKPPQSRNCFKIAAGAPTGDELEENMKYLDVLGGPDTYNHFPTGWAVAFSAPLVFEKLGPGIKRLAPPCCPYTDQCIV